jgi:DNA-binding LacI/PurR family transcriptional regulator
MVTGIRALARHLDISIGTVSKALNNRSDINAETRKRVLEAAAELGYVPNQSGRSLRRGSTQTIGFMIESGNATVTDADNFFMAVFDGAQSVFRRHHLDLIVLPCASDESPVEYLRRMLARGLVDAVIISSTRRDDARVPLLSAAQIPFVALGRSDTVQHPWIELDFEGVAQQSVDRLVARGHREIAVALPANDLNLGNLFLAGYRAALQKHGIRYRRGLAMRVLASDEGGYNLGQHLLALTPRPTAVLLSYELPATGLYRRLSESGVMPGRDMAIIGFRDSPLTQHLVPSLTSFTTSLRDLGTALAEMLLSRMPEYALSYPDSPMTKVWPLSLIPGDSDSFDLGRKGRR